MFFMNMHANHGTVSPASFDMSMSLEAIRPLPQQPLIIFSTCKTL